MMAVTVSDNGQGFELRKRVEGGRFYLAGLGLIGMQERVQLFGGTLAIETEVGQGTTAVT